MHVLVFVEANQRASISILRSLRGTDVKILLAISSTNVSYRLFLKYYFKFEQTKIVSISIESKEKFISSLIKLRSLSDEILIFPTSEKLTRWSLEEKTYLNDNDILLPINDINKYVQLSDKKSFLNLVSKYKIDIPPALKLPQSDFTVPFVVKPSFLDSTNFRMLKNPLLIENSVHFFDFQKLEIDIDLHFAQSYIEGPSFYYCGLYDKGIMKFDFAQQTVLQEPDGGSVIIAVPTSLPEILVHKINTMMFDLEWHGVMMMEFKFEDNKWFAIECNPRFWGPLQLSLDNGINFSLELLRIQNENFINRKIIINKKTQHNYVWSFGLLNSFILMIKKKKRIQYFKPIGKNHSSLSYRDIWLRLDTFIYFFIEFIIILYPRKGINRLLTLLKSKND